MKLKYFDIAKRIAQHSNHHQHKLGCVIVRGNNIVALGFNQKKTHPKSTAEYNMLHAEISAIINSRQSLEGCDAYVYRATRHSKMALAKPCPGCESALRKAGIKQVWYTNKGKIEHEKY